LTPSHLNFPTPVGVEGSWLVEEVDVGRDAIVELVIVEDVDPLGRH